MIPVEITEDLKSGLSIEDTLIKHGTNLRALFDPNYKKSEQRFDSTTYIRYTKHNSVRIVKWMNGKDVQFGTYKNQEDALKVRNELIKCDWDKSRLEEIYEKTGVKPNKRGGY
ncbi:hypothetical protein [Methanobrevibacter sp.]